MAIDYFTKLVEAISMKMVNQYHTIGLIREFIICRFGLPETIKADQGTIFTMANVVEFVLVWEIQLLNSSPYYAQANGQAESTDKTLKAIV